jgi:hypothetical protein
VNASSVIRVAAVVFLEPLTGQLRRAGHCGSRTLAADS